MSINNTYLYFSIVSKDSLALKRLEGNTHELWNITALNDAKTEPKQWNNGTWQHATDFYNGINIVCLVMRIIKRNLEYKIM